MLDYQSIYHTGVRVPHLDKAMTEMGASLGLEWAEPHYFEAQTLWTPERGLEEIGVRVSYSVQGPQHVELLEGSEGSIWDGSQQPGVHHIGLWSDDIPKETAALVAAGWNIEASADTPDNNYGGFIYFRPPTGGLLLELVSAELKPVFEQWWAGGTLG